MYEQGKKEARRQISFEMSVDAFDFSFGLFNDG